MKMREIIRCRFRSPKYAELGHFMLLFCTETVKKCTKMYNARALPLLCFSVISFFGGLLVAVVVVVWLKCHYNQILDIYRFKFSYTTGLLDILANHKQIGLPLRGRPILLSLVWLQTELDSTQSYYHYKFQPIAKISVTSPIVINMPTRELFAGETEFFCLTFSTFK